MFGLTSLGIVHTAISLVAVVAVVAVVAGVIALLRDGRITPTNTLGRVYLWTTVLTCLTGFGIFQHGGFGKPHALGVLTLLVIAGALLTARGGWFGQVTVAWSATFLFHLIPAITETSTRLPLGAPLLPNADAPQLQVATAILGLLFVVGAVWQVRRLRA